MAASDHLNRAQHPQLFDTSHLEAKRDYSPEKWLETATYHSSRRPVLPQEGELGMGDQNAFGAGFHHGTLHSAITAAQYAPGSRDWVHPVQMGGQSLLAGESTPSRLEDVTTPPRNIVSDDTANDEDWTPEHWTTQGAMEGAAEAIGEGFNIPYHLDLEDRGTVAFRSPRENLKTWGEDVMSDPNAPSRYRAQAEHGVDLVINRSRQPQSWEQLKLGGGSEFHTTGMEHGPAHPRDEGVKAYADKPIFPQELTHSDPEYWDERGIVSKPQFMKTKPGITR